VSARRAALEQSLKGKKPTHLPPSAATREDWRIELPRGAPINAIK